MQRRTRTLIVLAVAILCATVASVGVLVAVRRNPGPPKEKKVPVVVAARAVSTGMCLADDDLKIVEWPEATKVKQTFAATKDLVKRGLIASLTENEPITEKKLAPAKDGCGLPPAIEAGKRAISVKVNEVIGVAGFVLPGAKVDVLVTIRQDQQSTSRIVVSNVKVLTAGTSFDQEKSKDGKPLPATVVTLMVTPSDAERIALAAAEGQILLTLRNPSDTGETRTAGVRTPELLGGRPPGPDRPLTSSQNTVVTYRVEVIRGGKPSKETVR